MKTSNPRSLLARIVPLLFLSLPAQAAVNIAQTPLFLLPAAPPIVMLNVPKDHQLYYKAFDDYSDLDGDGSPETTYKHSIDYEGYFNNKLCYSYASGFFAPSAASATKYCNAAWSGNFLNWATMTRMDMLRKLLYGGNRSQDTSVGTILERSYLPNDAHSFAKFYQGADLPQLTPFDTTQTANGITLCNTTQSSANFSQLVEEPPLLRVAKGDFSLWAANERWQCQWQEERIVGNGNIPTDSGLQAASNNPSKDSDGLGDDDYIVRVQACTGLPEDVNDCKIYKDKLTGATTPKPVGMLQRYGDDGKIHFGLLTGSYGKSKSGGVLRKNAAPLTDEINTDTDGTFKTPPSTGSIINTLNKLRIYGYRHSGGGNNLDGTYLKCFNYGNPSNAPDSCDVANSSLATGSDDCPWSVPSSSIINGQCSNWGNPQSELFLESLLYLSGQSASPEFLPDTDDGTRIDGLVTAAVQDPIPLDSNQDLSCSALNIVQVNAATSSFDSDGLSGAANLAGITSTNALTDNVGDGEGISNGKYFIGEILGSPVDKGLCTAKTIGNLSQAQGLCPEEPGMSGSYQIAGLAHFAHTNDIRPDDRVGKQLVNTFGFNLAQKKPKVEIPIPNDSTGKTITLIPACHNSTTGGSCALVDFKILPLSTDEQQPGFSGGKLYVNWEDSEQGGDFDQDMWGIIRYYLNSSQVIVQTDVISSSTQDALGFGYIISGTQYDGFHAHSGVNNFSYPDSVLSCESCQASDGANIVFYEIGTGEAKTLQDPLYYATKWGGFFDGDNATTGKLEPNLLTEWDAVNNVTGIAQPDGQPDHYYSATNPNHAGAYLEHIFTKASQTVGSGQAPGSNAGIITSDTLVYLTRFNSFNWSGDVIAYKANVAGPVSEEWRASDKLLQQGANNRHIFTYLPSLNQGTEFLCGQNSGNLCQETTNNGIVSPALIEPKYVSYLRGDFSNPDVANLRSRNQVNETTGVPQGNKQELLGDIINARPLYISTATSGYDKSDAESTGFIDYKAETQTRIPMLAVGANDGMLHVFDASNKASGGTELFAYVPNALMDKLPLFALPSYTSGGAHQFFVDNTPTVSDAYFDADGDTDKEWRSVLLGTLGAGGKGIFALDISFQNPNDYKIPEPTFSAQRILWEINTTFAPRASDLLDDLAATPKRFGFAKHLGYTFSEASVAKMADGNFAAVFGNGYNSSGGDAVLYIVDIKTGHLIRSIATGTSGDNGLSTPLVVDSNNDAIADAIYAGDLQGNFWKFDVRGNNPNDWQVALTNGGQPVPLFKAQPITAKPIYSNHPDPSKGILLFFGTGSYFQVGDNIVGNNPPVQSFYGIADCPVVNTICTATSTPFTRDNLTAQTIDFEQSPYGTMVRATSDNPVDYASKKGWYMDLLTPKALGVPGTAQGERVTSEAIIHNRRLIFLSKAPITQSCKTGGDTWITEINPVTGGRLAQTPFDLNGDNKVDGNDQLGDLYGNGQPVAASGIKLQTSMISTVSILKNANVNVTGLEDKVYGVDTATNMLKKVTESTMKGGKRQSWVQLR